ncbi:hypothetical protein H8356DRAFT_1335942 [Neocallimastix lanati (nom. inval.)]|nr:hypothetical protein H8356DRAFT_1335942 [Neocallimastix sp. JGI-2020a]
MYNPQCINIKSFNLELLIIRSSCIRDFFNVFYSKFIKRNLISINQLIKQNYKIIFSNNTNSTQAIIYNEDEKRIYNSISDNKNIFKDFISKNPTKFTHGNQNNKYEINKVKINNY